MPKVLLRHERVTEKTKFDPRSFRTMVRGSHRIIIGCPKGKWNVGKQRCSVATVVQSIRHPKDEKHNCPLKNNGLLEGAVGINENLPKGAVRIYDQVLRIEGEKRSGPYKGKWFHDFTTPAAIYGLPDGSILIK